MQDFMESVLNAAEAIPNDANSALLIFGDLVTILNVDVNVTGMNADVAVSFLALVCNVHIKDLACLSASSAGNRSNRHGLEDNAFCTICLQSVVTCAIPPE